MYPKVKIPQLLSYQLVMRTDYIDVCLHLYKRLKQLKREKATTAEGKADVLEQRKATLRMLRRCEYEHATQLREYTRSVSTFLVLKSVLAEVDNFDDSKQRFKALAADCEGIHVDTFTDRIKSLEKLKLVTRKDGKVYLASWYQVCELFKVPLSFGKVRFYYVKRTGRKIPHILQQRRMDEKEQQCKEVAKHKLVGCNELQYQINCYSGKKPTLSALAELQLAVFKDPALIDAFGLDDWLIFNVSRPDTSLSYRFWSVLFGYRSIGGFAALKKKLYTIGLIVESTNKVELPDRVCKSRKSRSNTLGTVVYNRVTKTKTLHMPNSIQYLSVNTPMPEPQKP
jgi:hypothetical protein